MVMFKGVKSWYQSHVGLVWAKTWLFSYLYANGMRVPSILVLLFLSIGCGLCVVLIWMEGTTLRM